MKIRKRQHDEANTSEDTVLSGESKLKIETFLPIIDGICIALKKRISAYDDLNNKFGFLVHFEKATPSTIQSASKILVSSYPKDLEPALGDELVHFFSFIKSISKFPSVPSSDSIELQMFKLLHANDVIETFPNVEIMLRIYLCMFITNCTGERSFSKLKLIKNYLRNTMGQERLSPLSLLSIEHENLRLLDFTDIINKFATMKARKTTLS